MRFVDVTNDIAFRKIFGNENKKKSLISFLNSVIVLPQNKQITDVEITNPYQLGKLSSAKSTIVDVKARDEKGNTFIIEMQIADFDFFHKRILYYTSQSYVSQIDSGERYDKLQPVYFIGILEFEIGNNPNYFSRHKVLDVETNEQVIQDVEFNFIELPKFTKTIDELKTLIDQWTYFIKNAENLNVVPENVIDEGLQEAYKEADKYNWTKLELEDYERAAMKEGDERNRLRKALRIAEKAAKEATEKATRETAERVTKETAERVTKETAERVTKETAKNLKTLGVDIEIIMTATGLSRDEIESL